MLLAETPIPRIPVGSWAEDGLLLGKYVVRSVR